MISTRFAIVAIAALMPFVAQAQQAPTLIIGTTALKLGMQRDFVIGALSSQYIVKQMDCAAGTSLCREYILWESDHFPAGSLQFDKDGTLVKAVVERLREFQLHDEGDIAKTLVTVLSSFAAEGLHCAIGASTQQSYDAKDPKRVIPAMLSRQAVVECGDKRLRIIAQKQEGYPDSMQLSEEIGCPENLVGACEKK